VQSPATGTRRVDLRRSKLVTSLNFDGIRSSSLMRKRSNISRLDKLYLLKKALAHKVAMARNAFTYDKMSTTSATKVLISGANRGIGKRLLELYLATPNHHVIAVNRDATRPTSQALLNLPTAHGSKLTILKIDSTSPTDAALAAQHLKRQDVTHLDIVVANAGIYLGTPLVRDLDIADLQASLETNVFGTVRLYQAMRPLLLNADRPVWVTIGSSSGWLE
jgi:hypothetical protein